MATRGSYVHILWENYRGHPDNVSFMQFSTKIDGFEQKDSQGFENSYNSYEQYPLEKFLIFTIYQNYTLALKETGEIEGRTCFVEMYFDRNLQKKRNAQRSWKERCNSTVQIVTKSDNRAFGNNIFRNWIDLNML